jgi:CRISPR type III-A-associated protein Csm2
MSELEPQQNLPVEPAAEAAQAPEAVPAPEPAPQEESAPAVQAEAPSAPPPPAPPAAKPSERPPQKQGERRERPAGRPEKGERGERGKGPDRGGERGGDRGERRGPRDQGRGADRPRGPEPQADIDLEKLVADSLYLDNQAHAVVARMRDMDSGTRSQLRRLFSAVRRACRAAEGERQHQFVMLRARLAYTIARHQLRSLDSLERLLLQVTRKNDARGYERFRDLFEAIVAYNE